MNDATTLATSGLANLIINSVASGSPGKVYFANGTSGILTIATGGSISGSATSQVVPGQLIASNNGTWSTTPTGLQASNTAIINLLGTATTKCQYLQTELLGVDPQTFKSLRTYGTTYAFTYSGSGNAIQTVNGAGTNVTPTPAWPVGASGLPVSVSPGPGGALPNGLSAGTQYYVNTNNGTGLLFLSTTQIAGTGTQVSLSTGLYATPCYITAGYLTASTTTTVTGSNTINFPVTHGWANGTVIMFTGTLPSALSVNTPYYVVGTASTSIQVAYYSGGAAIALSNGNYAFSAYVGNTATNTPFIAVLDDPTTDTYWTSGGNPGWTAGYGPYAVLENEYQGGIYSGSDQQRFRIQSICSTVVALGYDGSALTSSSQPYNIIAAKNPNSRIHLISRNVAVLSTCTSGNGYIIDYTSALASNVGYFACQLQNVSYVGTTFLGSGIYSGGAVGAGHVISGGTFSGTNYGLNVCTGLNVISGTFSGTNYGLNGGTGANVISGTFSGTNSGLNGSIGANVSGGTFSGNQYGINSCSGVNVTGGTFNGNAIGLNGCTGVNVSGGTFSGNANGLYSCTGANVSGGTFSGNQYGINSCYGVNVTGGTFNGNQYGLYQYTGTVNGSAVFSGNGQDIYCAGYTITCFAPDFRSTTQVASYLFQSQNVAATPVGVFGWNVRTTGTVNLGWVLSYTPGGKILSQSGTTNGNLSPDVTFVSVATFQDNRALTWIDIPIYGYSGQTITVNIASKASISTGFTSGAGGWTSSPVLPHMAIVDPDIGWNPTFTSDELASVNLDITAGNVGTWQTATLSYTPSVTGPLKLRIMGQGGTVSGNGFGTITIGYNLVAPSGGSATGTATPATVLSGTTFSSTADPSGATGKLFPHWPNN
jgi:hypothetical protein